MNGQGYKAVNLPEISLASYKLLQTDYLNQDAALSWASQNFTKNNTKLLFSSKS